jgi:hypothetical protein
MEKHGVTRLVFPDWVYSAEEALARKTAERGETTRNG